MQRLFPLTILLLVFKLTDSSTAYGLTDSAMRAIHLSEAVYIGNDSVRKLPAEGLNRPRKAAVRSLILPGLGQLYNREPWKLAFIYGGAGVAGYFLLDNQRKYVDYQTAYATAYRMPFGRAKTALINGQVLTVQQLKRASDQYRQQRDLTIILSVAGWALNVIEANVAAHLQSFDLSDNLSMHVSPALLPSMEMPFIPGIRVVMRNRRTF